MMKMMLGRGGSARTGAEKTAASTAIQERTY